MLYYFVHKSLVVNFEFIKIQFTLLNSALIEMLKKDLRKLRIKSNPKERQTYSHRVIYNQIVNPLENFIICKYAAILLSSTIR